MSKRRYAVWTYRFIASGRLPEGKSQVKRLFLFCFDSCMRSPLDILSISNSAVQVHEIFKCPVAKDTIGYTRILQDTCIIDSFKSSIVYLICIIQK